MRRVIITGLCAGLSLGVLVGCSSGTSGKSASTERSSPGASPRPVPHDPATRFAGAGVPLPGQVPGAGGTAPVPPVALQETRAFVVDGSRVSAVELATGKVAWSAGPRTPARSAGFGAASAGSSAPVPATVGGTPVVLAVFAVTVPGQGTVADRPALELVAVNAASGQVAWTVQWDQSSGDPAAAAAEPASPRLLGVDGTTAVVATPTAVYGIDLATRRTRWTKANFEAHLLVDRRVVGVQPPSIGTRQSITALTAADGRTAWRTGADSHQIRMQGAGPRLIAVTAQDYRSGDGYFTFLQTADGTARGRTTDAKATSTTCRYDQASVTVCSGTTAAGTWAVGYDAVTGERLWALPQNSAGRVAPTVSAVWHSTVYGTTRNGPVTLDARTGTDRPGPAGVAPIMVNPYAGLTVRGGQIFAHRTTG